MGSQEEGDGRPWLESQTWCEKGRLRMGKGIKQQESRWMGILMSTLRQTIGETKRMDFLFFDGKSA